MHWKVKTDCSTNILLSFFDLDCAMPLNISPYCRDYWYLPRQTALTHWPPGTR